MRNALFFVAFGLLIFEVVAYVRINLKRGMEYIH